MGNRPDTTETVRIALELLRRIPRNRKISASELHEQLESLDLARDLRTVQRQLEMLSRYFDIERDDRSKPYGYRWKEKAAGLAVPMLSEQESLLLTLAEQHLKALLPASVMKSMESFFVQARTNLGTTGKPGRDREWLSKVRIVSTSQPLLPPKISPGVFEAVSNALYGNRWLDVDYKNSAGKRTAAAVMPLGLAQQGTRLYLVCRFRDYDDERSLALNRILSAKASTLTFERPKDFDLKKFDDDGRFGYGEGKRVRLTFNIGKGAGYHLLESRLSEDQTAVERDDCYEISATVVDSAMLEWWIRGFGDDVWNIRRSRVM